MERYGYMQDSPTLYKGVQYKDIFSMGPIVPPEAVSVYGINADTAKRPDIFITATGCNQQDAWMIYWLNGIPCSFGVAEGMQLMVPA